MSKPLVHFGFNYPAAFGLNTQEQNESLDPKWATTLVNWVFDQSGRVAARNGTRNTNETAISPIKTIHEYIDANANTLILVASGNKIYKRVGSDLTDISGTITTPTDDHWQFCNFNGKCVGFQAGHAPIYLSDVSGTFVDSTGTQYNLTSAIAAGGRLWGVKGSTLYYSDLLINNFAGGSSGIYDLSIYWKNGMDIPVAITEFNGQLVVFGRNNIIILSSVFSDATIIENISGIGCASRDSIQTIGNDIIFLSTKGVTALSRLIQEKSMPERDVSKNVRDYLLGFVNSVDGKLVKSSYNKKQGFYLLSFPNSNKIFHFDIRSILPDGSFRVTEWQATYTALESSVDDVLYIGTQTGYLQTYQDYLDDVLYDGTGGIGYTIDYWGVWGDFGQEVSNNEKMPKRSSVHIAGGYSNLITLKWRFDFDVTEAYNSSHLVPDGVWYEFGVAEFGEAEFGTGNSNIQLKTPMSGNGRVMQFGITSYNTGSEFGLQRIDIQAKLGKLNG